MQSKPKWTEIQDQHLNTMIRLAFRQAEMLEVQQIIESCEDVSVTDDRFEPETAYARFLEKLASEERQIKKKRSAEQRRRWVVRVIEIAACFVLILGVTAHIAIANIDALRSKVLEALIQVQERFTEIGMVEDVSEAFYVPEEWIGEYYPTYIPDGYELVDIGQGIKYLEYENENGQQLVFDECSESAGVNLNTEGAAISYDTIRGHKAMFVERNGKSSFLIWWIEDRYFIIASHESRNEMMKMAENVKKIVR